MSLQTEIHFHLLPGVDDGPSNMDESLELAELAIRDGTTTIVNTPHICDVDIAQLDQRLAHLRSALKQRGLTVEVLRGGELAAADVQRLTNAEINGIAQGPPEARWVLLEAPHEPNLYEFAAAAEELRARGFAVVIAHPERSQALDHGRDPLIITELGAGSWLQVSGDSITGAYGP